MLESMAASRNNVRAQLVWSCYAKVEGQNSWKVATYILPLITFTRYKFAVK